MEIFFAKNLEKAISKTGRTKGQFAEELGIAPGSVSKWTRSVSYPSFTQLIKIVEVLGVDLHDLVFRTEGARLTQILREKEAEYGRMADLEARVAKLERKHN